MNPIQFEGVNVVYAKDQPEYLPLPAQCLEGPNGEIITCWELTPEEMEILKKTGKLWISMFTFNKPLQPIRPFVQAEEFEPRKFRELSKEAYTLQEIGDIQEAERSFFELKELLCETHAHLLEMVRTIIEKEGMQAAWAYFQFERKLPAHVDLIHKTFEYLNYKVKEAAKNNA